MQALCCLRFLGSVMLWSTTYHITRCSISSDLKWTPCPVDVHHYVTVTCTFSNSGEHDCHQSWTLARFMVLPPSKLLYDWQASWIMVFYSLWIIWDAFVYTTWSLLCRIKMWTWTLHCKWWIIVGGYSTGLIYLVVCDYMTEILLHVKFVGNQLYH